MRVSRMLCSLVVASLVLVWLSASRAAHDPVVVGSLDVTGSDTLAGLMMRWGEQFERRYPGVRLQLQASGSATAPPALTQGTSRIGAMSRRMTDAELAAFVARHGYPPTRVPVAIDALVVFVHRNNPLEALSLSQLDAIFSDTRRCGADEAIDRWGEVGLDGVWQDRPIDRHSRNSASGTFGVFKREVLCHGDFRRDVNRYPGSAAVVAAVAESVDGIGYAGMGYVTAAVKPLALIDAQGQRREANAVTAIRGAYPLTRSLYLYINLPPDGELPPLERAFFDLVLSPAGQARVREAGFIPLPEAALQAARATLKLDADTLGPHPDSVDP
ncbi:phosphate ABC transporter substrate-binding protein, PhoT family (TC 3.A.1.7.1) [Modicisalibacter muralis]|uniref:Phosphate ABC transporter substrate-binding protein, PhoT family (TC 3.A.1.7.1) n=1 Tax=Modicisalibacter muralis TaxID=119000 RepID=A0A1G9KRZ4_9GAMM|nr:phosphate ABC transporter substrate-binding protein [Halomonas muralis]SDL52399.1 phosphate ABC transporter substrate-binding protein, PhoT family (TC 3.A.1.7.1) [Halomonas muralis]